MQNLSSQPYGPGGFCKEQFNRISLFGNRASKREKSQNTWFDWLACTIGTQLLSSEVGYAALATTISFSCSFICSTIQLSNYRKKFLSNVAIDSGQLSYEPSKRTFFCLRSERIIGSWKRTRWLGLGLFVMTKRCKQKCGASIRNTGAVDQLVGQCHVGSLGLLRLYRATAKRRISYHRRRESAVGAQHMEPTIL